MSNKIYHNPKNKQEYIDRGLAVESPNDFMRAFAEFVRKTGRNITPTAFRIIRRERNEREYQKAQK